MFLMHFWLSLIDFLPVQHTGIQTEIVFSNSAKCKHTGLLKSIKGFLVVVVEVQVQEFLILILLCDYLKKSSRFAQPFHFHCKYILESFS